ncbi:MAG: hypothetical protein H6755_05915 [Candidatus Omnitrophica bacterium]|nr:hypothetical protein [Candidatus Omnitrophota bacterium]MCB9747930.1 hypothetical protein [Candidatus Omnitrophota bacterium]
MAQSITDNIFKKISGGGRGLVYTTKDFLAFGSRDAVDQGLCRLYQKGLIRRLKPGIYDFPRINDKLGGELSPNIENVAYAIARKNNIRIMISGALAANKLGLSTQVPAQKIFLTDGPNRKVKIGNFILVFRHVAPKRMTLCGKKSEVILQALDHIGKDHITDDMIKKIRDMLTSQQKDQLMKDVVSASQWLNEIVNHIVEEK